MGKTVCLLWGKDYNSDVDIVMNGQTLYLKNSCKHVGVTLSILESCHRQLIVLSPAKF